MSNQTDKFVEEMKRRAEFGRSPYARTLNQQELHEEKQGVASVTISLINDPAAFGIRKPGVVTDHRQISLRFISLWQNPRPLVGLKGAGKRTFPNPRSHVLFSVREQDNVFDKAMKAFVDELPPVQAAISLCAEAEAAYFQAIDAIENRCAELDPDYGNLLEEIKCLQEYRRERDRNRRRGRRYEPEQLDKDIEKRHNRLNVIRVNVGKEFYDQVDTAKRELEDAASGLCKARGKEWENKENVKACLVALLYEHGVHYFESERLFNLMVEGLHRNTFKLYALQPPGKGSAPQDRVGTPMHSVSNPLDVPFSVLLRSVSEERYQNKVLQPGGKDHFAYYTYTRIDSAEDLGVEKNKAYRHRRGPCLLGRAAHVRGEVRGWAVICPLKCWQFTVLSHETYLFHEFPDKTFALAGHPPSNAHVKEAEQSSTEDEKSDDEQAACDTEGTEDGSAPEEYVEHPGSNGGNGEETEQTAPVPLN
jgi:hypothetical protein